MELFCGDILYKLVQIFKLFGKFKYVNLLFHKDILMFLL